MLIKLAVAMLAVAAAMFGVAAVARVPVDVVAGVVILVCIAQAGNMIIGAILRRERWRRLQQQEYRRAVCNRSLTRVKAEIVDDATPPARLALPEPKEAVWQE